MHIVAKHTWLLHLITIAVCAYFAARATGQLASGYLSGTTGSLSQSTKTPGPAAPSGSSASEAPASRAITAIVSRNIFCSTCEPVAPAENANGSSADSEANASATPVRTSLKLQLLATLVGEDRALSFASILDETSTPSQTGLYGIGAKVAGTATIVEIDNKWVRLINNGRQEFLTFGAGDKAAPVVVSSTNVHSDRELEPGMDVIAAGVSRTGGNRFSIQRGVMNKLLADPSLLSRTSRLIPSTKDGQPNGFTVYGSPGSLIAVLGLFSGDTVTSVNGHSVATPDKALEVLQTMRNASHLSLNFTRKGVPLTHEYDIQ